MKNIINSFEDLRRLAPNSEYDTFPIGAEDYTRKQAMTLVWTQVAMVANDIKTIAYKSSNDFESLPHEVQKILKYLDNPRVPKF